MVTPADAHFLGVNNEASWLSAFFSLHKLFTTRLTRLGYDTGKPTVRILFSDPR